MEAGVAQEDMKATVESLAASGDRGSKEKAGDKDAEDGDGDDDDGDGAPPREYEEN